MKFLGLFKQKCLTGRDGEVKLPAAHASLRSSSKSGYILPMVLVVALIGVLLGLGRLMMFKYQTQIRIDRQREIDRVLATRSALKWLETQKKPWGSPCPPADINLFEYKSSAGKLINVAVQPAPNIYPQGNNEDHMDIENNAWGDYQGSINTTSTVAVAIAIEDKRLKFIYNEASTGDYGRVSMDMEDLGNWKHDIYGRRYWYEAGSVLPGYIRFAITPINEEFNPENPNNTAIWIEQYYPAEGVKSDVNLYIQHPQTNYSKKYSSDQHVYGKGFEFAGDLFRIFEWNKPTPQGKGYYNYTKFDELHRIPDVVSSVFVNAVDVRVTLEVEARIPFSGNNTFLWVYVQPAYEYEVHLDWDSSIGGHRKSEISTVVHWKESREGTAFDIITYDTHGTEAK
jgi:hypothetical protein